MAIASDKKFHSNSDPEVQSVISSQDQFVAQQIAWESDHDIKYRSCSWQKTAALLFSEYICLAIMSFPWSYSVLGLVPSIILTIGLAAVVLYTSLILWRFCLAHPEIRDVCDIGQNLFGGKQWAYNVTAVFFILNNIFIQALHVIVGAKYLNTVTNHATCTIAFGVVAAVACFLISLPRTLSGLAHLGTFSAVSMGIAVSLAIIFAGIQDYPAGYKGGPITVTALPLEGTTYVQGMSAMLNIAYTFIGQIALPSFIAEMENPKDFPKALWAVTICEIIVFSLCGGLMYHWVGNEYVTAPAFGSLQPTYEIVAFSFAIPTIIFLGALYASVSARMIFFRIFKDSHHLHSNTVVGWASWTGILIALWILGFIIAEVIPFFSDMLSLMSSLFDGWFGFIFWGMAYFSLTPAEKRWNGPWRITVSVFNAILIAMGIYILTCGTYVSIQSIINSYAANAYGSAFTCANNGL